MKLHDHGVYLVNGQLTDTAPAHVTEAEARKGTIAYGILKAHNTAPDMKDLRIKFDSMTSHDITYVGIIQTARANNGAGGTSGGRHGWWTDFYTGLWLGGK